VLVSPACVNAPQGFLQSVVSGYGGLRYESNPTYGSQLELTPQLPSGSATRLYFKGLHFLGSTLSLDVTKDAGKISASVLLRNVTADAPDLVLMQPASDGGESTPIRLQQGQPVAVAVGKKLVIHRDSSTWRV
jgi:hypothetical protein